jgi:alkanesulfonate monooxygenase SsuD/methylene tetrahydromethanopterin reductase-like flavin-dependent oxidoreductase (luciferase family)
MTKLSGQRPLEVGLGVWGMTAPYARPAALSRVYREAVRHAQLADRLGFDSMWMGEHRISYSGTCPSLLMAAAYLAAATERIAVCPGVLLLPIHESERVAQACAALRSIAPGRLKLGIGLGYREAEFAAAGLTTKQRLPRFKAHLDDLVGRYAGLLGPTEIWFAGDAEVAARRAGRYGGSLLLSQNTPLDAIPAMRGLWLEHLRESPRQVPKSSIMREVWATDGDDDGIEIRARLHELWLDYGAHWVENPLENDEARQKLAAERVGTAVIGSPDEVVEQLAPAVRAGVDQLLLKINFQGADGDALDGQIRLLAATVLPALKALRAGETVA